ncbi:MAG: integrase catalytic domain-containing protein [Bacteroidales bacterium]
MGIFIDHKRRVWLSFEYLESVGIPKGTIKYWVFSDTGNRKRINQRAFIEYDTIPKPTRRKLYGKEVLIYDARNNDKKDLENQYFEALNEAYNSIAVAKWRNAITEAYPELESVQVTNCAHRASVIEKALTFNIRRLEQLYKAYLRLYPKAYSTKQRFCTALTQAKQQGVLSVAVDKRAIREHVPLYGNNVKFIAGYILNHNRAFGIGMSYEKFTEACEAEKQKCPSYQWFRTFYATNKNTFAQNRYGQAEFEKYNQGYAKIIPALYAGDQWQMDGWRIPIYCKKYRADGKTEYFVTYNLFSVIDAHSRKIIGYCISESENTQSILKGIETAVKRTLTLPYEIVADNHSFNKTKEAGNIKSEMELLGVTWTVDSNPRRKAILERSFRTLGDKYFKNQYGYIGQGIKSKEKGGITQQELRDIFTKPDNFLIFEQVVAIATDVILQYNANVIKKLKDTPVNLYEKSEKPHAIPINQYQYLQLFTLKTEHKITHGQINIQRGAHRYEYQLSAEDAHGHNGQTVTVRYADFDTIYLYDRKTDKPICSVNQKLPIHGAKANQTDKDKELMFMNKGRLEGVKAKARNQKQLWRDEAALISPDAYETVNRLTTPKDIIEKLRTDENLRGELVEQGINPYNVPELPKFSEMLDPSMNPQREKARKNPYHKGFDDIKKTLIPTN